MPALQRLSLEVTSLSSVIRGFILISHPITASSYTSLFHPSYEKLTLRDIDQVGPSMPSMSESLHVQRIDLNIFDCGYIQSSSRGLNRKIRLRILEQVGFANESEIMLPLFSFFCHFCFLCQLV